MLNGLGLFVILAHEVSCLKKKEKKSKYLLKCFNIVCWQGSVCRDAVVSQGPAQWKAVSAVVPLISTLQFPLWVEPSWAWCSPREGMWRLLPALCSQELLLLLGCGVFLETRAAHVWSAPCWCSFRLSPSATNLLSREVLQSWALTLGCIRMLPWCWWFFSDERWNSKVWNNHSLWCCWRISLLWGKRKKKISVFTHTQSIISLY